MHVRRVSMTRLVQRAISEANFCTVFVLLEGKI
jgi:hypothetical protein